MPLHLYRTAVPKERGTTMSVTTDTDQQRWVAMARVILEKIRINDEPALEFIDRCIANLPSAPLDFRS